MTAIHATSKSYCATRGRFNVRRRSLCDPPPSKRGPVTHAPSSPASTAGEWLRRTIEVLIVGHESEIAQRQKAVAELRELLRALWPEGEEAGLTSPAPASSASR